MKTTIDLPHSLLEAAKAVAAREGTTLRALLEQGLRMVLEERKQRTKFRLRKASFRGNGLHPGIKDLSWDRIRELSYEGRGS